MKQTMSADESPSATHDSTDDEQPFALHVLSYEGVRGLCWYAEQHRQSDEWLNVTELANASDVDEQLVTEFINFLVTINVFEVDSSGLTNVYRPYKHSVVLTMLSEMDTAVEQRLNNEGGL